MPDHERATSAPRRAAKRGAATTTVTSPSDQSTRNPSATRRGSRPPRRRALPLSPALRTRQAKELQARLARRIDGQIELTVTDNRTVMITVRRDTPRQHYALRVHHVFVDAPEEILDALARYVALDDRRASRLLGRYLDENDHRMLSRAENVSRRSTRLRSSGRVHDLQAIFAELNTRYFDGAIEARITWGRNASRGRARSSVRLGSYTLQERLIRIHPGLDQDWVPSHYLRWVIFHELLHVVHPIPLVNGRRRFHTPDFAAAEARFNGVAQARAWERKNLPALLRI